MSNTNNQNSCSEKPCQSRPLFDHDGLSSNNEELAGRPLLHAGVMWVEVLRRFLIPGHGSEYDHDSKCLSRCEAKEGRPLEVSNSSVQVYASDSSPARPKLLDQQSPLVTNKSPLDQEIVQINSHEKKPSSLASLLYQVHEASTAVVDEARHLSEEFQELVQDGKTKTSETIKTMRGEDAVVERYSAVAVSGLLGYLAGWRRGVVTKLVYSITGVAAMATICYPEEAQRHNKKGLELIRRILGLGVDTLRQGRDTPKPANKNTSNASNSSKEGEPLQYTKGKNTTISKESLKNENNFGPYSNVQYKTFIQQLPPNTNTPTEHEHGTRASSLDEGKLQPNTVKKDVHNQREMGDGQTDRPSKELSTLAQRGKLSMECREDVTRTIPYSPALPAPPKTGSNYRPPSPAHRHIPEPVTSEHKPRVDAHNSHEYLGSADSGSRSAHHCDPSGSSALKVEAGQESSPKDATNISLQYHPLNKKLSRYYIDKNKEMIEQSKSEHDGLYPKNG